MMGFSKAGTLVAHGRDLLETQQYQTFSWIYIITFSDPPPKKTKKTWLPSRSLTVRP